MHFTALRLSGFKSFLDQTELEIASGLTGVVGPNGCGKSNLVEALRWVMGESSAKRMRGGEMDDVIFGGSDKRPARNLAEVSLVMDNAERNAPSAFNDSEVVEVTRRIERSKGSDYKVNSKGVRAKDVALLFQDSGTGPHSASLVSQGRIGALIAAKPTERRQLLEEAAGITGLHTRRHEAELRLKSAETNMQRVDDVMGTMDAQLQLLKKQARQASRYRNINAEVRRQEAALLYLRWNTLYAELQDAHDAFSAADTRVGELMTEVARFENERLASAEGLPALRQSEAAAAAGLQRLVIAREQIDDEAQRIASATQSAAQQQLQATADKGREVALADDATRAINAIETEVTSLQAASEGTSGQREALEQRMQEARAAREAAEGIVADLQQKVALAEAAVTSHQRRIADVLQRRARTEQRKQQIEAERARVESAPLSDLFVSSAQREVAEAEARLDVAATAIDSAEQQRSLADTTVGMVRQTTQGAEAAVAALTAEHKAIERALSTSSGQYAPVLDKVSVQRGYEQALAVAFGEDIGLPLDADAPTYWQSLPAFDNLPAFPPGVTSLANFVQAPAELARRLALVGVVHDAAQAALFADDLQPGQILVTPEGAAWRWDGVVVKPGAPAVSALRLQQRNRLDELNAELATATVTLNEARERLTHALNDATASTSAVRAARDQHNVALAALTQSRRAASEAEAALSVYSSRITAIKETEDRVNAELSAIMVELAEVEVSGASLPDASQVRESLNERKFALNTAQAEAADAEAARRQFEREETQRAERLATLTNDRQRWIERSSGASQRIDELSERLEQVSAELAALSEKPAQLAAQREALVAQIETSEAARRSAADALATAENDLRERERALKQAETSMTEAREQRATAQAEVGSVQQAQESLVERILEKCECQPEGLAAVAEIEEGQPVPEPEAIEARLAKLVREREVLGPVNLRAEQEADEQQAAIDTINQEKADLIEAIAKLRSGISSLNKEARERMMDAYGLVQGHFKRLFVELFGGGQAEIKLVNAPGSDDPLDAGLEIICSPPGKKLQNLTLLSGGEQALTSLALLFAVFLVNPSPICVLDEVDAPLDEANIGRFCNLLDVMVREGKTRFLVITHQRLTMSRMDRLYGVTMMEKGVSQLVSVDLSAAQEIRGAA